MRALFLFGLVAAIAAPISPAQAVGCVSGAVAGGVAGHYAGHHAVLGAVGGCVAGHELHKKRNATELQNQQPRTNPPPPAQ